MAKTIAQQSSTQRQELVAILLGTQQQRTAGESIRTVASNLAASSFETTAIIAGALVGAAGNAAQSFEMERNYRAAERQVTRVKLAEHYADRLLKLQHS